MPIVDIEVSWEKNRQELLVYEECKKKEHELLSLGIVWYKCLVELSDISESDKAARLANIDIPAIIAVWEIDYHIIDLAIQGVQDVSSRKHRKIS